MVSNLSEISFGQKLSKDFRFHHIGIATTSVDDDLSAWGFLGYYSETDFFEDVIQGVRGLFLISTFANMPRLELLEGLPGSKTLEPFLQRGPSAYHFGYLVDDLQNAIRWCESNGGIVIAKPALSTAFGVDIAFVKMRSLLIIELIESGSFDREERNV